MVDKIFKGIIGLILGMVALTGIFNLLNAPNTLANISALLLIVGLLYVGVKFFEKFFKKD
jgi:hypothetical protein